MNRAQEGWLLPIDVEFKRPILTYSNTCTILGLSRLRVSLALTCRVLHQPFLSSCTASGLHQTNFHKIIPREMRMPLVWCQMDATHWKSDWKNAPRNRIKINKQLEWRIIILNDLGSICVDTPAQLIYFRLNGWIIGDFIRIFLCTFTWHSAVFFFYWYADSLFLRLWQCVGLAFMCACVLYLSGLAPNRSEVTLQFFGIYAC